MRKGRRKNTSKLRVKVKSPSRVHQPTHTPTHPPNKNPTNKSCAGLVEARGHLHDVKGCSVSTPWFWCSIVVLQNYFTRGSLPVISWINVWGRRPVTPLNHTTAANQTHCLPYHPTRSVYKTWTGIHIPDNECLRKWLPGQRLAYRTNTRLARLSLNNGSVPEASQRFSIVLYWALFSVPYLSFISIYSSTLFCVCLVPYPVLGNGSHHAAQDPSRELTNQQVLL